jgi:hypothetical protein
MDAQQLLKCTATVYTLKASNDYVTLIDKNENLLVLRPTKYKPIFILKSYKSYVCIATPWDTSRVYFLPQYKYSKTTQQHERKFFKEYLHQSYNISDFKLINDFNLLDEYYNIDTAPLGICIKGFNINSKLARCSK